MTTADPIGPMAVRDHALRSPQSYNEIISSSFLDTNTTNHGAPVPRGPVTARLTFYSAPADGSKPHNYVEEPPAGAPKFNFGADERSVELRDLRGREALFTLDHNAFQTLSDVPAGSDAEHDSAFFDDDERVKAEYYPEVERLLLSHLPGAHSIVIFDHTVRRSRPGARRAPVTRVHIDQTPRSAEDRVRLHLSSSSSSSASGGAAGSSNDGDDANIEKLLAGRYRIVNVWRPLNGPVVAHPLAVADSSTVRDEDLVAVEHRYPHRTGETAGVKFDPDQRWYYWSGMTNRERLLLKCFDSDDVHGRYGRVPHTAFADPRTVKDAPGRESIEVRALVFG